MGKNSGLSCWWFCVVFFLSFTVFICRTSLAGNPSVGVASHSIISETSGGFADPGGTLGDNDWFGSATSLGDLDGDGITDLAVGAANHVTNGVEAGAIWILFLNSDGTVKAKQKITEGVGGFTGDLDWWDSFGLALAYMGDLDGDTKPEVAVSAFQDDDGGSSRGAVWILSLNSNGTVYSHQKISSTSGGSGGGGFGGVLDNSDKFGATVANVGDMNNDGFTDLAVGARYDGDGGYRRGALWLLYLNSSAEVIDYRKISDTAGGFNGTLVDYSHFAGNGIAAVGDIDGDGETDLVVSETTDDGAGTDRGAIWILLMNDYVALNPSQDMVKSEIKINDSTTGMVGYLNDYAQFGMGIAASGDLNNDNVPDVIVSAPRTTDDATGEISRGSLFVLYLNSDGSIYHVQKIDDSNGGLDGGSAFGGDLVTGGYLDWFGSDVQIIDDLDGDGFFEIGVGQRGKDDGGTNRGGVWIINSQYNDGHTWYARDVNEMNNRYAHQCLGAGTTSAAIQNGLYLASAFDEIQPAINAAVHGDRILVCQGTYSSIDFGGKNVTVQAQPKRRDDPVLIDAAGMHQNRLPAHVIDGTPDGSPGSFVSAVTFAGTEGASCLLEGFTITNGMGTLQSYSSGALPGITVTQPFYYGGGIIGGTVSSQTQATILNCAIVDNHLDSQNDNPHDTITDGRPGFGGGVAFFSGTMQDCLISGNLAYSGLNQQGGHGAGMAFCEDPLVYRCAITFNGNDKGKSGGGLANCGGTYLDCLIMGNLMQQGGGGLSTCPPGSWSFQMRNCNIIGNSGGDTGSPGGIYNCSGEFSNSVLYGNFPGQVGLITGGKLDYCYVQDQVDINEQFNGTGNIGYQDEDVDVLFSNGVLSADITMSIPASLPWSAVTCNGCNEFNSFWVLNDSVLALLPVDPNVTLDIVDENDQFYKITDTYTGLVAGKPRTIIQTDRAITTSAIPVGVSVRYWKDSNRSHLDNWVHNTGSPLYNNGDPAFTEADLYVGERTFYDTGRFLSSQLDIGVYER